MASTLTSFSDSTGTALPPVNQRIAEELGVTVAHVDAAVALLDEGATVPFIARYRKEATRGLDDAQLRTLALRLEYLRELEERRSSIENSLRDQGKLTGELAGAIAQATTKARLEDLYLPFKPKRRTKAQIAREAGLESLADALLAQPTVEPAAAALAYVNPAQGVADVAAAMDGARAIWVERFTENADLIGEIRERVWRQGLLRSIVKEGKATEGAKFSDYFDHSEPLAQAPSHRILALFRGEREGILDVTIDPNESGVTAELSDIEQLIADSVGIRSAGRLADAWLVETVRWAWRTRVAMRIESDLRARLREIAEEEAVRVFAANVRNVLLAAPAGGRVTMGLDPGIRTGVKVAVVDGNGKVLATQTIYPHAPKNQWDESLAALAKLAQEHGVKLMAIGNGTASRETAKLAAALMLAHPELNLTKAMVSEAGASVYSASEYASQELPELDVSLRGAVSIARRLQDPLAELVKIDPKSIGVGQYQHDVTPVQLSRSLDAVVEDCVNAVGVDLNTASIPLLRRVSGINEGLATMIVSHRDTHGSFTSRQELLQVPRLGEKVFQQCAGFLRIRDGADPLDSSAVHPESYPVVHRMSQETGSDIGELIGNSQLLASLAAADYVDEMFGLPTVTDIIAELDKPGRDPRPEFTTASFTEGVESIEDVLPGMVMEGVVTNVAAFGAFVDIGVHQDGLVHVSQLSNNFVKDPNAVVSSGDVVKVRVTEVDVPRHRISLTMKDPERHSGDNVDGGAHGAGDDHAGGRHPGGTRDRRSAGRSGDASGRGGRGGHHNDGKRQAGKGKSAASDSMVKPGSPSGERRNPASGRPHGKPRESRGPVNDAIADAFRRAGYFDNQ